MKRLQHALLITFALLLTAATVWADDDVHHHRSVSAVEMGAIGVVAASVMGAGVYLVRRRRGN